VEEHRTVPPRRKSSNFTRGTDSVPGPRIYWKLKMHAHLPGQAQGPIRTQWSDLAESLSINPRTMNADALDKVNRLIRATETCAAGFQCI
jgi:hypothetical protein